MADSEQRFKATAITIPENWVIHSATTTIGNYKYKPDRSLKNEEGKICCVIEMSTSKDRKSQIGELLQAELYFKEESILGKLMIIVPGTGDGTSSPVTLKNMLMPYFKMLVDNRGQRGGVDSVYLISKEAFYQICEQKIVLFSTEFNQVCEILNEQNGVDCI